MRVLLFVLVVAAGIAYGNSLSGPFQYDDLHSVQYNPHIRSLKWVPTYFVDPSTFSGQARGFMYRPLLLTTYAVDYALWGQNATAFRVTNLLIHGAASAAFGALSFIFLRSMGGAAVTGLLFLVHPMHSEAINYISARSDSLMALFFLLACICALRRRSGWMGLSYGAALLVKSVATTLAPMLAMLRGWEADPRSSLGRREVVGVGLLTAGYIGILWSTRFLSHSAEVFPRAPAYEIWTQLKALIYYLWLLAIPTRLTIEHPFSTGSPSDTAVMLAGAVVVSVAVLGLRHRLTVPGMAAIWFGVCMIPYCVLPLNIVVAERRAYLACAGGLLLAGWAWRRLYDRRGRQVSWIGVGLLTVLLVLTVQRNTVWATDISLWTDAVSKNPVSARAHVNLALAHRRAHDPVAARLYLDEGLRLDSDFAEGWVIAGDLARDNGEMATARAAYERAVVIQPTLEGVYHNLGNLSTAQRNPLEAVAHYERTLEINPRFAEARNNLGQALEALGRDQEALRQYEHAVLDSSYWIHTDDPVGGAWYNLARLADRLQDPSRASRAFQETINHLSHDEIYSAYVDYARRRLAQLQAGKSG